MSLVPTVEVDSKFVQVDLLEWSWSYFVSSFTPTSLFLFIFPWTINHHALYAFWHSFRLEHFV